MSSTIRTYGNRSKSKRKTTPDDLDGDSSSGLSKRRKLGISTSIPTRPNSPARTEKDESSDDDPILALNTPKRLQGYALPTPQVPPLPFGDSKSPSKQGASTLTSNPSTPTKLSKRMLSRSKTDTSTGSLGNSTSTLPSAVERTSSLPNINRDLSSEKVSSETASPSSSRRAIPSLPSFTGTKTSATRTYAGSYRSFLVTIPRTSGSGDVNPQATDSLEEDLQTPESYLALRSRWGVDSDEEADTSVSRDNSLSPTKSHSVASDASPSRNKRSKANKNTSASRIQAASLAQGNPLKSITELRNKGENRRFMDEINALFDGMDKSASTDLRRASALELASKYAELDFFRKAKATDCFIRTWQAYTEAQDTAEPDRACKPPVLDLLTIYFVAAMSRHTASLVDLAERSREESTTGSVADKLFDLLAYYSSALDPLRLLETGDNSRGTALKNVGINKRDQNILPMIHRSITGHRDWYSDDSPVTASLMLSQILHLLPPDQFAPSHFSSLLESLRKALPTATLDDLSPYVEYELVFYHLQLLNSHLLNQWCRASNVKVTSIHDDLRTVDKDWLIGGLCTLGLACELEFNRSDAGTTFAHKSFETLLRILVTLTQADTAWAESFVRSPYSLGFLLRAIHKNGVIFHQHYAQKPNPRHATQRTENNEDGSSSEPDDDKQDPGDDNLQALDTLCLALGVLTNIVHKVPAIKNTVRNTRLNASCGLKALACATACRCSSPSSGTDILVNLYAQQRIRTDNDDPTATEDARAEADVSFLRGHLAILFGLLMMKNKENQTTILSNLPSPSPSTSTTISSKAQKRAKLDRLADHARDFAAYYKLVTTRLGGQEGAKDTQVAQDVVQHLESLRDDI